uniref:Uncharacterized protein n=1 Tax=Tolypothrix bouteillei VB521301 TaxID=1479485 RepID=A0A0C1NGU7_9CYAN
MMLCENRDALMSGEIMPNVGVVPVKELKYIRMIETDIIHTIEDGVETDALYKQCQDPMTEDVGGLISQMVFLMMLCENRDALMSGEIMLSVGVVPVKEFV